MTNNIGMSPVNRVGMTSDGRVLYQIQSGNQIAQMSVAQKDADTFEKSFNDVMKYAPQYENYIRTTTPEQLKKKQSTAKWMIGGLAGIGAFIPAVAMKKSKTLIKVLATLGGGIAGFFAGSSLAAASIVPPGAAKISKASHTIAKLDIRPEQ